jgi:hypothetical protein
MRTPIRRNTSRNNVEMARVSLTTNREMISPVVEPIASRGRGGRRGRGRGGRGGRRSGRGGREGLLEVTYFYN